MNGFSLSNPSYDQFTDQQLSDLDECCDRFDRELVHGRGPRIETFLREMPVAHRVDLLTELLAMEIEYRTKRGETVAPADYFHRFPEHEHVVRSVLVNAAAPGAPGNETVETPRIVPAPLGSHDHLVKKK